MRSIARASRILFTVALLSVPGIGLAQTVQTPDRDDRTYADDRGGFDLGWLGLLGLAGLFGLMGRDRSRYPDARPATGRL
jgi:hypothetical protein